MLTPEKRIELMTRTACLVRELIERNDGHYDGGTMAPNIQSVIDLGHVDEQHLVGAEEDIARLEIELGLRVVPARHAGEAGSVNAIFLRVEVPRRRRRG